MRTLGEIGYDGYSPSSSSPRSIAAGSPSAGSATPPRRTRAWGSSSSCATTARAPCRRPVRPVRAGVDRLPAPGHERGGACLGDRWSCLPTTSPISPPGHQGLPGREGHRDDPIASLEQHGPHLPLATDTIQADEITRRAAERAGPLHARVWFGYSPQHMYGPGEGTGRSRSARRSCSTSTTTWRARSSTTGSTGSCS